VGLCPLGVRIPPPASSGSPYARGYDAAVAVRVEELPENKVRLTVDVPSHDVQHAVEHAASDLAASAKVPGFRKGKVPMQVLVSRIGKERLYSEAVESHIEGWFRNALVGTKIRPVARPQYDYQLPETADTDFSFTATVDVQPRVEVADWKGLQVPAAEVEVPRELVDQQLEALRFAVAELIPVEGRPAKEADTLVVDLVGADGTAQRDYVIELGLARVVEELEEALVGMSPGEAKQVEYELGDGQRTSVEVTLKELKEKVLPPLDDELARAASEFDTLEELSADIEARLREQIEEEVETSFRAAAVDTLVAASNIQPSAALVQARTTELLTGLVRSLERRGISPETYLAVSGQTPQQLEERLRAEAAQSVARELALEAVADQAGIEITEDELREFIRENADAEGDEADQVVEQVFASGRHEILRDDLRMRKALDRVVADVERIPLELAAAREKLWTPEKEKGPGETKLWTPGSKEPSA
jgi:trigger factor